MVEKSDSEEDEEEEEGVLLQPNLTVSYRWLEKGRGEGGGNPPNVRLQQEGFRRAYLALAFESLLVLVLYLLSAGC